MIFVKVFDPFLDFFTMSPRRCAPVLLNLSVSGQAGGPTPSIEPTKRNAEGDATMQGSNKEQRGQRTKKKKARGGRSIETIRRREEEEEGGLYGE